jgi:hypothetical protein
MQNKANFRNSQINVTVFYTKDYENKTLGQSGKNKANSKPIKANLLNDQMNVNKVLTKDYENIANWTLDENKANTKPIQTQTKPTCSELVEPISNYPCIFELAAYNLVLRDGNLTNFNGEYIKWQKRQEQTQ